MRWPPGEHWRASAGRRGWLDTPGGRRFHRKLGTGNKSGSALRSGRLFGEGPARPGQQALGTAAPAVRGRHGKAHQVRHARTSGQGPGQRHRCPQRRRDRPRRDAAAARSLYLSGDDLDLGGQPGWHQPPGPHPRAHHVELTIGLAVDSQLYLLGQQRNFNAVFAGPTWMAATPSDPRPPVVPRARRQRVGGQRQPPLLDQFQFRRSPSSAGQPGRRQPPSDRHRPGRPLRDRGQRQPPLLDQRAATGPSGGPTWWAGNAQPIVHGEGQNSLFAVAVNGTHLYWTNRSQGTVMRASLDGTNPVQRRPRPGPTAGDRGQRQLRVLVHPREPGLRDLPGQPGGRLQPADLHRQHLGRRSCLAFTPPRLGFTPSPYDFGEVRTREAATQSFTLANSGGLASAH